MKKRIIAIAVMATMILSVFALAGCQKEGEYVDKELKAGFEVRANSDVSPADYCAYSSDISEFDIDNVSIDFYYGSFFNISIQNELEHGRNYPYVELFFENESASTQEPYFIKKTTDSYTSEKYRCEAIVDENGNIIGIDFNHHEELTIPKELFIGKTGKISFLVRAKNINDSQEEARYISGIYIYYKVTGNKVILANEDIK